MLHGNALEVSFVHRQKIKKVFGDILGLDNIEHFSLDLVNPQGEMIFFSGTPQHAFEICRRGLGPYDGIISPDYYENFEFYWWNDANHKGYADQIKRIREGYLGLKHGFMLVRKWNNFHLIYSFATKQNDPDFQSLIVNNINSYLKMGDYAYSMMKDYYAEYCEDEEPPLIEKFYPFEGGKPPSRFTKTYKLLDANHPEIILEKKSNIIILDFGASNRLLKS